MRARPGRFWPHRADAGAGAGADAALHSGPVTSGTGTSGPGRGTPVPDRRVPDRPVPDGPASGAAVAADELLSALRPVLRVLSKKLPELVVGLGVLLTVLAGFAVAGAAIDDVAIEGDQGFTVAEVLEGSSFARTLIRFTLPNGEAVVPERGVSYPRGLRVGATVGVEYEVADPENVRVAGRSSVDGLGPVLLGVAGVWAVLGPLALWLRRRRG